MLVNMPHALAYMFLRNGNEHDMLLVWRPVAVKVRVLSIETNTMYNHGYSALELFEYDESYD